MSIILVANNAQSALTTSVSTGQTTISLTPGTGALFPQPTTGQYFKLTITDAATQTLREIVHVTNVTSDTLTIVRAQEGTAAQSWNAGDIVVNMMTAGTFQALAQTQQVQYNSANFANDIGSANTYAANYVPAISSPIPWAPLWLNVKTANTGASTFNATGSAYALVGGAHQALQGGELIAGGLALIYWNPTLNSGGGQYVLAFCTGAAEQVAAATQSSQAVQLGQADGRYAALNGNTSQVFSVANATTSQQAVALGQADARYAAISGNPSINFSVASASLPGHAVPLNQAGTLFAAIAGSSSQVFSVQTATAAAHAIPLSQADGRYAALNGNTSQVFSVANATTSQQAVALGQADARYAAISGNPANNFSVATATLTGHAIPLGQADGRYAALAGNSGQVFSVANATTSQQAVALGQADALYAALAGNSSQSFAVAATTSSSGAVAGSQVFGFRNVIINGNFNFWGRGTSFTTPAANTFTAERWRVNYDGTAGTFTISRQPFNLGQDPRLETQYNIQWNQTVAGSGGTTRQLIQPVESVRTLAGQTVTLSFVAWAAGSYSMTTTLTQWFGSGGSPSSPVSVTSSSVSLTTTPTLFSVTVNLASIAGKTIGTDGKDCVLVAFNMPLNTTFTVNLSSIQLEAGGLATQFELRPYPTEQRLCERYWECSHIEISSIAGSNRSPYQATLVNAPANNGWAYNASLFRTAKRAVPTITLYSVTSGSTGVINLSGTDYTASASDIFRMGIGSIQNLSGGSWTTNNVIYPAFTADCEL